MCSPVARLARPAVADAVGQHDEIARRVENLAGTEQLATEGRGEKSAGGAARAMADQHRVAHDALRVFARRAERDVMDSQLGQRFAGDEFEVLGDEVALHTLGCGGGGQGKEQYDWTHVGRG